MRILKTRAFGRFSRSENIPDRLLIQAVREIEAGLVHANLGGGLIKQRVPRTGSGKSGGYRTLLVYRAGDLAVFLLAFAKNRQSTLPPAEEEIARETARGLLLADTIALDRLVRDGKLIEVDDGN